MSLTLKLWQALVLAALALLAVGLLVGRYVVPAGDGKFVAIESGTPWGTVYVKKSEEYEAYRSRADESTAQSNLRAAIPSVEAYYADNNTYAGMTLAHLQKAYDANVRDVTIRAATSTTYCVESTVASQTWMKPGPASDISSGSCG